MPERNEDFREAFSEIIDRTLELSPQAFVHAGDLFHRSRPSNTDILFVAKELLRLIKEGIEVMLLPGNHDKMSVKGEIAPQSILELLGAKVFGFTREKRYYTLDGVEFWGLPYMGRKEDLLGFISETGERAKSPAVLVLHQYLYPLTSYQPCLYLEEIPKVFSYCALGHWHIPWRNERYAYPGSPEPIDLSAEQAKVRARCFYLVEIDDRGIKVEPQFLTKTRPFFYLDCREDELVEKMEQLRERMDPKGKKPMLRVKLRGGPDMRAEAAVENAILSVGLKKQDFMLSVIPERTALAPNQGKGGQEETFSDILERFFGNEPELISLVGIMREAVIQAEAEREFSGTQAGRDRQIFIEAAKKAAIEYLEGTDIEAN